MSRDSSTTHTHRGVPVVVEADRAQRVLGDVETPVAEPHPRLGIGERVGEAGDVVGGHLQEVERDPLRRLRPDPGQPAQLVDEGLDRRGVRAGHGQDRSSINSEPGKASASRSIGDFTDSGGTSTRSSRSTSSSSIGSSIGADDRRRDGRRRRRRRRGRRRSTRSSRRRSPDEHQVRSATAADASMPGRCRRRWR